MAVLALGCGKAESSDPELNGLGGASNRWPEEVESQEEKKGDQEDTANPWLTFGAPSTSATGGSPPATQDESSTPSSGGASGAVPSLSSAGGMRIIDAAGGSSAVAQAGGTNGVGDSIPPVAVILPELRLIEYWEGPGSVKLLGLRNTGQAPLVGCFLEIYNNGGTDPWRNISLPDMAPDEGIFLCTSPVERSDCTHPLSTSTFNGNDALVLRCGDQITDSLGRVGEDPGEAWTDPSLAEVTSQDARLWRCGIEADVDPHDAFFIAEDWERATEDEVVGAAFLGCSLGSTGLGGTSSG